MSLIERLIVASTLAVLGLCLNEQKEIQIPLGRTILLQSSNYPDTSPEPTTSLIWTLISPPGTQVKVECEDLRISPTTNCEKGYLVLKHSGVETEPQCGSASGLKLTSADNKMIFHFELIWAAGVFECKAEAVPGHDSKPKEDENKDNNDHGETIKLHPGQTLYDAINLKPVPHSERKRWEFITEPGHRIGIKCPSLWITKRFYEPECVDGSYQFDLGSRIVEICNSSNNLILISSAEKLVVTVEVKPHASGFISCTVLTTTGDYFEQYKNEPELEEVDSSEHGHPLKKGPKNTTCECGWANKRTARILNGLDVEPHEFPWMAGLLPSADSIHTFCGGTIVTKRHVISAAHCTTKITATHVVVGMDHLSKRDGGHVIAVENTINHGYYPSYATSKDISILILAEEIKFSRNVGPACLPTHDPNLINQPVLAIGWGSMTSAEFNAGRDSLQLKKAYLRAISMESCNPVWDGRWPSNPPTHVCTWHRNRDVCFGDSGGPVVWLDPETNRYTLIGIPSVCDGCILEKPALHTALHYYYPWVVDTIKSNNYGEEQVCTKLE
uniref:Venom s1 protease with cub domain 13 n=1 Tax=Pristhesancus plagipennis TaxID=1955184 RepID=A0A1Q1NPI6_PRIPG|nr:venom s1 protease with cub domain 13 [Pristhesancus plagipennis]